MDNTLTDDERAEILATDDPFGGQGHHTDLCRWCASERGWGHKRHYPDCDWIAVREGSRR